MAGRVVLALAAIVAAFAVTGAGTHQPETAGPENPAAARAVAVLTGLADGDLTTALPADFREVMGYEPTAVTSAGGARMYLKPAGDCSSPFGPTTFDFDLVCKQHDFGYDLLRYAARTGGELGPWARRAIDTQLAVTMDEQCAAVDRGPACHAVAWAGARGVEINSWRQGYGLPVSEQGAPYVLAIALIAGAVAGPPIVSRLRARARQTRPAAAMSTAAAK